jgi:hypothetical protein
MEQTALNARNGFICVSPRVSPAPIIGFHRSNGAKEGGREKKGGGRKRERRGEREKGGAKRVSEE